MTYCVHRRLCFTRHDASFRQPAHLCPGSEESWNANPKITVVLSDDLLCHLRKVAQQQHIPLRWLVAGMLCDTFESGIDQTMNRQAASV